jgi:hypothetical protein
MSTGAVEKPSSKPPLPDKMLAFIREKRQRLKRDYEYCLGVYAPLPEEHYRRNYVFSWFTVEASCFPQLLSTTEDSNGQMFRAWLADLAQRTREFFASEIPGYDVTSVINERLQWFLKWLPEKLLGPLLSEADMKSALDELFSRNKNGSEFLALDSRYIGSCIEQMLDSAVEPAQRERRVNDLNSYRRRTWRDNPLSVAVGEVIEQASSGRQAQQISNTEESFREIARAPAEAKANLSQDASVKSDEPVRMLSKPDPLRAQTLPAIAQRDEGGRDADIEAQFAKRRGRQPQSDQDKADIQQIAINLRTHVKVARSRLAELVGISIETVHKHFQGGHGQLDYLRGYAAAANLTVDSLLESTSDFAKSRTSTRRATDIEARVVEKMVSKMVQK